MMGKPLSFMEKLVGRRCPPHPRHRDTLLAFFADDEGNAVTAAEPAEAWLRRPFREARRKGLLRLVDRWSICGGTPFGRFEPTAAGLVEAIAAKARVKAARQAREAWGRDAMAKAREHQKAVPALDPEAPIPEDGPAP
ncbi:hypothetical protein LAZ40_09175 [Cereibacter sphaeroides]|uniref:hypothetical protein n=1 Tax=Cereibacter sphaeroides TaxID=1063 RepID=UPI001F2957ED|nr:hypothetical protein [Cereibacter sphaeroides]MCE6959222.1 hypothetical protein [Cereibacter sphaeroides]MCE6972025.1 hypothetical protein [Cereibacter sphaeroides]